MVFRGVGSRDGSGDRALGQPPSALHPQKGLPRPGPCPQGKGRSLPAISTGLEDSSGLGSHGALSPLCGKSDSLPLSSRKRQELQLPWGPRGMGGRTPFLGSLRTRQIQPAWSLTFAPHPPPPRLPCPADYLVQEAKGAESWLGSVHCHPRPPLPPPAPPQPSLSPPPTPDQKEPSFLANGELGGLHKLFHSISTPPFFR